MAAGALSFLHLLSFLPGPAKEKIVFLLGRGKFPFLCIPMQDFKGQSAMQQAVVASARDPHLRERLDVNQPELRRSLVLTALESGGATVERVEPRPEALIRAVSAGVLTAEKLDFLRTAHAAWQAAAFEGAFEPEADFSSAETAVGNM